MKRILIWILVIYSSSLISAIEIGTGLSSVHSGRTIPTLALAYTGSSMAVSVYSTGVRNDYYYHSAYGLHVFFLKEAGDIFGGKLVAGAGVGSMYSKAAFQDLGQTQHSTQEEYVLGPAFRINCSFTPNIYLNVDATYGLRNLGTHLLLNFQDVISTSIGVRF